MKKPTIYEVVLSLCLAVTAGVIYVVTLNFDRRLNALSDDVYVEGKKLDVTAAVVRECMTQTRANEININAVANTVQDAHDRIDKLEAAK